ncbi:MAG: hypothetical protein F6K41_12815 [Symploca sp. SIO3E6]|nr:hypothetical protein [Caldora sp. SIO3E6]
MFLSFLVGGAPPVGGSEETRQSLPVSVSPRPRVPASPRLFQVRRGDELSP